MTEKLFISEDAPAELKEIIKVSQKCLDNMMEFKVKADNGSLTLDDLEELTRRNNLLTDEFPKAEPSTTTTGFPTNTNNLDELEAVGNANAAETARLLEQEGGPAYKIDTFDQLTKLSEMPPMAIGKIVLDAAKEKREKSGVKKPKAPKIPKPTPKRPFHGSVYIEHLLGIQTLLYNSKTVFYDLLYDWENVEVFEERLLKNAKSFEDFRQSGVHFLVEVLVGEDGGSDVKDLKAEAAFVLATIETKNQDELEELIDTLKVDEELKPKITQALKFGKSSKINTKLESALLNETPSTQADFIEILDYRNATNADLLKWLKSKKEPIVAEKIMRASVNANLPIDDASFDLVLKDDEAPFYEDALFSGILAGNSEILITARKRFHDKRDKMIHLPLYFSCGCRLDDFNWIKQCLAEEKSNQATIMALGLLGLGDSILLLIKRFADTIANREEWESQRRIADALELITGARLELPAPDIIDGPKGKEYEISVVTGWKELWIKWWVKNGKEFKGNTRYRRGKRFDLGSCIEEMEYPMGNHWSRQYSYYELRARSGEHVAPFHADWYVREQKESIDKWKQWWLNNKEKIGDSQNLFAGTEHPIFF